MGAGLHELRVAIERRFNPGQRRDADGQWSDGIPGPSVRLRAQGGETLHLSAQGERLSIRIPFDDSDAEGDDRGLLDSLTLDAATTAEFAEELQILEESGTDYNRRVKKLWDKASSINPEGGGDDDTDPESKAAWDAVGELAGDAQRISGGQLSAQDGSELHYELRMGDEPGDMDLLIAIRPPAAGDDWDLHEAASDQAGAFLSWQQMRKLRREVDSLAGTAGRSRVGPGRPDGGQYASDRPPPRRKSAGSETLGYDPGSGRGTGYGTASGDERVTRLQSALNDRGHTDNTRQPLKVDGKFGPKTRSAVKKAQRKLGMPVNGKVTPSLLAELTTVTRGGAVLLYDRTYALDDIQIQRSGDGRTVEAYAAMFGAPYEVRDEHGHYLEVIDRSAFNRTLNGAGKSAMCLYNHGRNLEGQPDSMASIPLGTPLEIRPDGRGLLTVTRYNRGPYTDQVLEAIRNGDIKAQSFRGRIVRSDPNGRLPRRRTGTPLPTVTRHELGLTDYGPTPIPVNNDAEIVAVRSVQDLLDELQELDADERAELLRSLNLDESTHDGDPDDEAEEDVEEDEDLDETATSDDSEPGAEDPPAERSEARHSGRQQKDLTRRIRAAMLIRSNK